MEATWNMQTLTSLFSVQFGFLFGDQLAGWCRRQDEIGGVGQGCAAQASGQLGRL